VTRSAQTELGATGAAQTVLRNLKAAFGPLILVQAGGCSDDGSPLCVREGELQLHDGDRLIGEVEGVPFYCEGVELEPRRPPRLVLDVAAGPAQRYSLEGLAGVHFRTLSSIQAVCEDRPDR
jgi:uncharacterized protein (DUF779 family)